MVGWQGDQPLDFNGFCHSLSLILELSNSSQPFVQFRWHTEWIMSVTPEWHQNLGSARVIQTSHPQGELRISWRPLKMSGQSHETMQLTPDIHDRRGKLHRQDRLCEQRLHDRESFYEATESTSRPNPSSSSSDNYCVCHNLRLSSWGGQVVKGCKSGVASKYAQNKNNFGPSIIEIPLKFRMTPQTGGWGFDKTKTDPTLGCATIGFIATPHRFVSN